MVRTVIAPTHPASYANGPAFALKTICELGGRAAKRLFAYEHTIHGLFQPPNKNPRSSSGGDRIAAVGECFFARILARRRDGVLSFCGRITRDARKSARLLPSG
jgi:hypothetical protein